MDETPLDFLSSANAFKTKADFTASVNNLYRILRERLFTVNDNDPFDYTYRTDVTFYVPASFPPNLTGEFSPNSSIPTRNWEAWYKMISEANTVLSRIPTSTMSAADQTLFEARGKFFRAYAYSRLAYLFGGVPLVLEEVTAPKTDYVRATRQEVYAQCIEDLVFAAANLPGITAVQDGEISNLAAQHLLAELYCTTGQYTEAVAAATVVINDPNTALMTTRFGSRSTETPGDVYWDMFRRGNQNRSSGNKEGILVIQMENDVIGGAANTALSWPSGDLYSLERVHPGLVRDVRINGVAAFNWPAADYSSGGRGVGFMSPSMYFIDNAYQSDYNNDIRNANHNFVRVFKITNAAHPMYNQDFDFHNMPANTTGTGGATLTSGVPSRAIYPYQTKCTEPYNPPANLLDANQSFPYRLKGVAGGTYRDEYLFRLAETYLLRAEAYLGQNQPGLAAADINVVRARSNASAVAAGNVTLNYILDERMREFGVEEKRMFTLMRLGKWYDRIIMCNPFYAASADTKYNLWPIPQSEIERNNQAVLEQNPGY